MVVAMKVKPKEVSIDVKCVSNSVPGTEEGRVVNLHPSFTIPEDQLHQDKVFPWLEHVNDIAKEQVKIFGEFPGFSSLEKMQEFTLNVQSTLEGWQKIKKAWSLTLNGREDLAKAHLESYKDYGFNDPHELNYVLFHFGKTLLRPRKARIFIEANELTAEISRRFVPEYAQFRQYYIQTLHEEHLERYFDIFSGYFQDFSEFNQTLLFSQYDLALPTPAHVSSNSFKRTKMF